MLKLENFADLISVKRYLFFCLLILVCWHCDRFDRVTELTDEERLITYCGGCHLVPDPAQLPRSIWKENVLPEMAARLGFRYGGYRPTKGLSMQEEFDLLSLGVYPTSPQIDSADWWSLHDYILSLAPDTLSGDSLDAVAYGPLTGFAERAILRPSARDRQITSLLFDERTARFVVGSAGGHSYHWPEHPGFKADSFSYAYPITSDFQKGEYRYVTEVGPLNPSEATLGVLHRFGVAGHDTLVSGLKRAVYTQVVDLNEDGNLEILVCEYGDRTGQLSLFKEAEDGALERQLLYTGPGSIRTQVADLNNDGLLDVIALTAQGDESVVAFYQQGGLAFQRESLVRQPAVFGSSWFELFDYDGDGDLDLAIANGDNADYSNIPKPYHGLRLFLNNGQEKFTEAYFFRLNGCTRLLAHDFDGDGDVDFALTAYFADWREDPSGSFVYLENLNAATFDFQARTTEMADRGRWLLLEKGDYDLDGDLDIALASFLLNPGNRHPGLMSNWLTERVDLLVLENKNNEPGR